MAINPIFYVAGAILIYLAGVLTREIVQWALGEVAVSRAVRGELDGLAAKFRAETGVPFGPIEDVPERMANPPWLRTEPAAEVDPGEHLPETGDDEPDTRDDEDYDWTLSGGFEPAYSVGGGSSDTAARLEHGAFRRETSSRPDDGRVTVWPVNPPPPDDAAREPGQHRLPGEDTRDLSAHLAALHHEVEVAAP